MASHLSQRPQTPNSSQPPADLQLSPIPESKGKHGTLRRRPSFSFLRRSKSRDGVARSVSGQSARSVSGGSMSGRKLSKKSHIRAQEQAMRDKVSPQPPKIPDIPRTQQMQTFGGENPTPGSIAIMSTSNPKSSTVGEVIPHNVPIPPIPSGSSPVELYARTESITNRGRYSYASSAISTVNGPRKVRRKKDPISFNVLIIGARNSGKTSFLNFLRTSLSQVSRKRGNQHFDEAYDIRTAPSNVGFPNFTPHYLETDIKNERVGLTLWDSQGLERNVVDLQLREISSFLESKFEDTFAEENKVARSPGFRDTHIHCIFLVLDPARLDATIAAAKKAEAISGAKANGNSFSLPRAAGLPSGLDSNLDMQVIRVLQEKTTVVPVIAKADSITTAHMEYLKRAVWESIKRASLDKFETIGLGEDAVESPLEEMQLAMSIPNDLEERKLSDTSHLDSPSDSDSSLFASRSDPKHSPKRSGVRYSRTPSSPAPFPVQSPSAVETPYLPLSIISPDLYEPDVAGRRFPWGFADPYNAEHCDFVRLKDMIFSEWRGDLKDASRERGYEIWRTSRLNRQSARSEPRSPPRTGQMGYAR